MQQLGSMWLSRRSHSQLERGYPICSPIPLVASFQRTPPKCFYLRPWSTLATKLSSYYRPNIGWMLHSNNKTPSNFVFYIYMALIFRLCFFTNMVQLLGESRYPPEHMPRFRPCIPLERIEVGTVHMCFSSRSGYRPFITPPLPYEINL